MSKYSVTVYMKSDPITEITVNDDSVEFINVKDVHPVFRPFGVCTEVTLQDLNEFFESRCFPRERANCKEVLKGLGLDYYDPEQICRKTHGQQFDDFIWLQFSDEPPINYEDIKLRD